MSDWHIQFIHENGTGLFMSGLWSANNKQAHITVTATPDGASVPEEVMLAAKQFPATAPKIGVDNFEYIQILISAASGALAKEAFTALVAKVREALTERGSDGDWREQDGYR